MMYTHGLQSGVGPGYKNTLLVTVIGHCDWSLGLVTGIGHWENPLGILISFLALPLPCSILHSVALLALLGTLILPLENWLE